MFKLFSGIPLISAALFQKRASGAVLKEKRPTDEELKASEDQDISKMMQATNTPDQSQLIKSANPELSKVLSEETSNNKVSKDHGELLNYNL